MSTPTPKDHASKGTKFTVTVDGKPKTFTLPPINEETAGKIPGEIVYNAVMNPSDDMAQMRLTMANLEASGVTPQVKDALLSLPFADVMRVLGEWMGESAGSSE